MSKRQTKPHGEIHAHTLRWNRAADAKWRRMLCANCGSLFEIRPKQNLAKKIRTGTINGFGPFDVFHQLLRELQIDKPSAKMFVVMIDIDVLDFPHRQVHVAEIERAVPFLKPKSFCDKASIKIYSKIYLKNCHLWFTVPNYAVNAKDLVGRAIDRFYGETSNNESALHCYLPPATPLAL
jgi:hypothetical protein